MRFATSLAFTLTVVASAGASAGPALDDSSGSGAGSGSAPATSTVSPAAAPNTSTVAQDKVEYGADFRLRQVFVPQGLIELFIDRAAGGTSNTGWGFDLIRRRGNLELQLGFEHEDVTAAEGVYINKGDKNNISPGPNQANLDYILNPKQAGGDFGWNTIEFTFLNHAPLGKYVAVRYGGGAGLGIINGNVKHYTVFCAAGGSANQLDPQCVPQGITGKSGQPGQAAQDPSKPNQPINYNLPPVVPVVNAIIGLQIRPVPKAVINIETGIRTLPFFGISAGYFFY